MPVNKTRIGIFIPPFYSRAVGGGYHYLRSFITLATQLPRSSYEIVFVTFAVSACDIKLPPDSTIVLTEPKTHWFDTVILEIANSSHLGSLRRITNRTVNKCKALKQRSYKKQLYDNGVHVIYYPIQNYTFFEDFPFVSSSWDMGHASTYGFPEIASLSEIDRRNFWVSTGLKMALAVVAESQAGKHELVRYAGIAGRKILILPLLPSNFIYLEVDPGLGAQILSRFGVAQRTYFIYPAKFWAHKGHKNLLLAFREYLNTNSKSKLLLTGSGGPNAQYIGELVTENDLSNNVILCGDVSDEELNVLIKNALGLIMPSFVGPTNMPIIEAMALKCPVACTDLEGHREILGENGVYFDAMSSLEIVNALERISELGQNESYRSDLLNRFLGSAYTPTGLQNSMNLVMNDIANIRSFWPNEIRND